VHLVAFFLSGGAAIVNPGREIAEVNAARGFL
jgi:hypothetical protein